MYSGWVLNTSLDTIEMVIKRNTFMIELIFRRLSKLYWQKNWSVPQI